MTMSFNSNAGVNDPTLAHSYEASEEVPHGDAEVTVPAEGEAQPYTQRLPLSSQITLVCRNEVAP